MSAFWSRFVVIALGLLLGVGGLAGARASESLVFDIPAGPGDPTQSEAYCLEAEIYISVEANLDTPLRIVFEAPPEGNIVFNGDGMVRASVPGSDVAEVAPYRLGNLNDLKVNLNPVIGRWDIYLDGVPGYSGSFGNSTGISAIRFSMPATSTPSGANVSLGNIQVSGNGCYQ